MKKRKLFSKIELKILSHKYREMGYSEKEAYNKVAEDIDQAEKTDKLFRQNETKNKNDFSRQREKAMKEAKKFYSPKIHYDKDYDIFYFVFRGKRKVEGTIEVTSDIRLDVTKKGEVVAVEIENLSKYLRGGKINDKKT